MDIHYSRTYPKPYTQWWCPGDPQEDSIYNVRVCNIGGGKLNVLKSCEEYERFFMFDPNIPLSWYVDYLPPDFKIEANQFKMSVLVSRKIFRILEITNWSYNYLEYELDTTLMKYSTIGPSTIKEIRIILNEFAILLENNLISKTLEYGGEHETI